jgi:hypothetical protein
MKPFEPADIVFIEMLKARHESLKAQLAAAKRAPQDAQHAAGIAAELREMVDKATAEFFFELPTDSRRTWTAIRPTIAKEPARALPTLPHAARTRL